MKGFIRSRCRNSRCMGWGRVIIHSQLQCDQTAVLEPPPAPEGSSTTCFSEGEDLMLLMGLSPTLQKVLMRRQSHKLKRPDFALSHPYVSSVTAIALYRAEDLFFISSCGILFCYFQFLNKHHCLTETQLIFANGNSEEVDTRKIITSFQDICVKDLIYRSWRSSQ